MKHKEEARRRGGKRRDQSSRNNKFISHKNEHYSDRKIAKYNVANNSKCRRVAPDPSSRRVKYNLMYNDKRDLSIDIIEVKLQNGYSIK